MLILRMFLFMVILLLVFTGTLYLFTRNRGYLVFARQLARYAGLVVLIFALLYLLERYVLVGWNVFV
jgi:hypothetical protein